MNSEMLYERLLQFETEILIKEAREFIKIFTSSILTSEKNRGISKIVQ